LSSLFIIIFLAVSLDRLHPATAGLVAAYSLAMRNGKNIFIVTASQFATVRWTSANSRRTTTTITAAPVAALAILCAAMAAPDHSTSTA
jgi:hypothetical protein